MERQFNDWPIINRASFPALLGHVLLNQPANDLACWPAHRFSGHQATVKDAGIFRNTLAHSSLPSQSLLLSQGGTLPGAWVPRQVSSISCCTAATIACS